MSPQKKAILQIKRTGSTDGINVRTLAVLRRKKHIDANDQLTKRGESFAAGRLGGAIGGREDLQFGKRRISPAGKMPKRKRVTKAQERASEGLQRADYLKTERMTRAALLRVLGPTGKANAVKVAPADGSTVRQADVDSFTKGGWKVEAAGTAPAKVGGALPGHRADDWTFKNPDPLGPKGEARAVVIVGRVDAGMVDQLRASGWDVSAAPKRLREEPTRNPSKSKRPDQNDIYKLLVKSAKRGQAINAQEIAELLSDSEKFGMVRLDDVETDLSFLEADGLAHKAGKDLFGDVWMPGAKQRGLFENPSPGVMRHGEHASAEQRKAAAASRKKAIAWFRRADLVDDTQALTWEPPVSFVDIGHIEAIEYTSNKFDDKNRLYRHEVTQKRRLLLSTDGTCLLIFPPFRVTTRGIEG